MGFSSSHLVLSLILLNSGLATHPKEAGATNEAYVTFLQGEVAGSVVGVRVLGQSLREAGTQKDYVVICNKDTTSVATINTLSADGWIVKFKQEITEGPETESQQAGSRSQTDSSSFPVEKLIAWRMTEYHKLTLIEPDFVVTENVDSIFDCGHFCAAYINSDAIFDTGVMVIQPSKDTYKNMLEKFTSSEMTTEDSFLNEYFSRLIYGPMFNRSAQKGHSSDLIRLPANLNADATNYYMLNSRWVITDKVKIVRFSAFGLVAPWDWKFYFLLELNWEWNAIRERLPYNVRDVTVYAPSNPLFWGPFLLLLFLYVASYAYIYLNTFKPPTRLWPFTKLLHQYIVSYHHGNHPTFYSFFFLVLSYFFTFKIMPTTLPPSQAEFAFCMWSSSLFFSFLGLYVYATNAMHNRVSVNGRTSNSTPELNPGVSHAGKKQVRKMTFFLFLAYLASYVLLRTFPRFIHPFKKRVVSTLILLVVHIFVSCQVGHYISQLWFNKQ